MNNVTQSLKHLKWRLSSDKIIPNQKDIDAFNNIVAYINLSEQNEFNNNKIFVKLFTYILTFNSRFYSNNVKKVLNDIEECLKDTVYNSIKKFHVNIPMCNIEQLWIKHDTIYVDVENPLTFACMEKIKNAELEQYAKFEKQLKESLKTEYTEEQLIDFITKKSTELILKYKNND